MKFSYFNRELHTFPSCSMVDATKYPNKDCIYLCKSPYEKDFELILVLDSPTAILDGVPTSDLALSKDQREQGLDQRVETIKQLMGQFMINTKENKGAI